MSDGNELMRAVKVVDGLTVDGQPVKIFELLFEQFDKYICNLIELFSEEKKKVAYFAIRTQLFEMVQDCSSLSEAKFRKLAFGQILACVRVFKSINTPFLECLKELGIDPQKISLLSSIMSEASGESSDESQEEQGQKQLEADPPAPEVQ